MFNSFEQMNKKVKLSWSNRKSNSPSNNEMCINTKSSWSSIKLDVTHKINKSINNTSSWPNKLVGEPIDNKKENTTKENHLGHQAF